MARTTTAAARKARIAAEFAAERAVARTAAYQVASIAERAGMRLAAIAAVSAK